MADVSSIPAVLTQLQTALSARAGLAGVRIVTGDIAADTPRRAIVLHSIDGWDQTWASQGALARDETYTIRGWIWTVAAGQGETAIVAARNDAFGLLGELEAELRGDASIGGTALKAHFTGGRVEQGVHPDGRFCQLDFSIDVHARLR